MDQLNRPKTGGYSRFHLVLAITALPRLIRLNKATALLSLPRSVRRWACVAAIVPSWCRNFNRLPFRHGRLGHALGPTYPRLTIVAGEPWPLRRRGFSPLFAVTTAGICTPDRSTGPHGPASAQPGRPPTDAVLGCAPRYRRLA